MNKSQILSLYRSLIRESNKFTSYNYRHYALRKVRDQFRENRDLTDSKLIAEKISEAQKNLDLIKRQVIVGQLYSTDKLVIEYDSKKS